ncbi:MAG: helix-turn-helix transcriptional regulator [Clostridiales bacterium]|nr:helix-turn-helix transcriptional regulator [Clostridiales bacterium]
MSRLLHHFVVCFFRMECLSKKIGNNLKEARKFKGFTQKEVAAKMGMTQQQYSRFENGVFELNYQQILFLCQIYEVTPNELFSI